MLLSLLMLLRPEFNVQGAPLSFLFSLVHWATKFFDWWSSLAILFTLAHVKLKEATSNLFHCCGIYFTSVFATFFPCFLYPFSLASLRSLLHSLFFAMKQSWVELQCGIDSSNFSVSHLNKKVSAMFYNFITELSQLQSHATWCKLLTTWRKAE